MDAKAFSKLLEPAMARMDALEQRLERIETALPRFNLPSTNLQQPTADQAGGLSSTVSPSIASQKQPLDQNIPSAPPDTQRPYQYQPLDTSKNEIRILSLDPSSHPTDPITGTITHLSLDDAAPPVTPFVFNSRVGGLLGPARPTRSTLRYTALSYTWGSASGPGDRILVAGTVLRVTVNLAAALRQLRGKEATDDRSFWWIDALCINQADVRERNAQVALMRRIYGSASHVQVWLGAAADGSDAAMALVRKLGNPPGRGPAYAKTEYPHFPDHVRRSNLACVAALFQRPWWDRVWVRQEVALGYSLSFTCGGERCTLEELTAAEILLEDSLLRLRLDSKWEDMAHVSRLAQNRQAGRAQGFQELREKSKRGDNYIDLCALLLHSRTCQATDEIDKLFGVLGLADPGIYELVVDYRLPTKQAYRMAATAIITKTDSLNILSAAQNVDRENSLPSWAPNLSEPWKAQPFPVSTPDLSTIFSNATTSGRLAYKPAQYHFSVSGRILTVTGQMHGRIARLSAEVARSSHSNHELTQVLAAWTDFARSVLTASLETDSVFGSVFDLPIGIDVAGYATPEEGCMASLLLAPPKRQQQQPQQPWEDELSVLSGGQPEIDSTYAQSLLVPQAWIESRVASPLLQKGLRRYGVGRRAGHCKGRDVGLFPEEAQEGDVVVHLYGAVNPYVLRKIKGGYLLVGDASLVASELLFQDAKDEEFHLL